MLGGIMYKTVLTSADLVCRCSFKGFINNGLVWVCVGSCILIMYSTLKGESYEKGS